MFLALLSMGFGLTLRTVKFFNFAYGGAFLVGGYMMFWSYRSLEIAFLPSLLASLVLSGLYLLLSYKFIFCVLLKRRATNFVLLIASFGILIATSSMLGMIFGSQATILARHLSDINTFNILGARLNIVQIIGIILVPIIISIFAYVRFKTNFGRATRALEDDSEVAELSGIPKEKTLNILFFLSGSIAGLGGIMEGFDVGIIPASGLFFMLPVVVVVVLGGLKSFWGGIIGAFILAIAAKSTVFLFGGSWEQAVPFVILIIILLVRPEGLFRK